MYLVLVACGAIYCFLMLAWRRPAGQRWIGGLSGEALRTAGLVAALLVLASSVVALATQGFLWPAVLAVPAVLLLIFCAPPPARRLLPAALAGLGLAGLALALAYTQSGIAPPAGTVAPRAQSWQVSLVLQSGAFLAAGLWLTWHWARGAALAAGRPRRPARWGLLLPPAAAALALLIYQPPAQPAWAAAAAAAAVALIIAILLPAVSADLAPVAVIALGLFSFLYVVTPPRVAVNELVSAQPVSSGRAPAPFVPVYGQVDRPLLLVAAVQCAALLALGVWLAPRTIGVHARTLLGREADAELVGRVEQLTQTRADAVDTAAAEVRRLERDLHDGAQARLVALGMSLRAAERLIPTSPQAAMVLVAEAREASSKALTELRDLVRGVYPPVLADRGLADAVRALALDTPVRTETDIELPGRPEPPVESACYFAIAEALTNAVKHSGARLVQIRIRFSRPGPAGPAAGMLRIEVIDNGTGGADPARGSGLAGVERRLGTFDGILAVSSPAGGPTIIVMEVPCALSSPRTSSC